MDWGIDPLAEIPTQFFFLELSYFLSSMTLRDSLYILNIIIFYILSNTRFAIVLCLLNFLYELLEEIWWDILFLILTERIDISKLVSLYSPSPFGIVARSFTPYVSEYFSSTSTI